MQKVTKSNKKGFTLVELIAVIVILAVIVTIAIGSVSTIRSKVNEREYVNLATTIKTAAENYAEETGVNKMFVQTLIDKGKLDADDETKQIYDPRDNSSLNCQIINFENGEATLSENENPTCDMTLLSDEAIKIQYSTSSGASGSKNDMPNDYWFKDGITLSVAATGVVDLDLATAEYKWTSPLAPDRTYSEKELTIDNKYVDDIYQVTVSVGTRKYTAYAKVRIDKEPPKVFNLADTKPEDWSPNKSLKFDLSDAGSGIMGYQITFDNKTEPSTWVQVNPVGKNNENVSITKNLSSLSEGQYIYVWVKDVVGNTNVVDLSSNGDGALRIDNIDGNFDSVTLTGSPSNGTYSTEVTLSGKIQDLKSGAVAYFCSSSKNAPAAGSSQWKTITKTSNEYSVTCPTKATSNDEYYLHAIDAVGNVGTASYKVDNIDRTIDDVKLADTGSGYRTSVTLKGTATDSKSGIVGYAFTTSSSRPSSFNRITATNREISYTYSANSNKTYYFHVIDAAGNWDYDSITVRNVVVEKSYTDTLYSTRSSVISDNAYLSGAVEITRTRSSMGSVSASLSGSYVYYTASGGYAQQDWNPDTCRKSSYSYYADYDMVCRRGYVCSNGGSPTSDGWCEPEYKYRSDSCGNRYYLSDSYEIRSCPTVYQEFECRNGEWKQTGGSYASTYCSTHYKREGGQDWYGCFGAGSSATCKDGDKDAGQTGCKTMCYWEGDYRASCPGGTSPEYYCSDRSDYLVGSRCYYCDYGSVYNSWTGLCEYSCKQWYDYWEYDITIYYYVLK